MVYPLVFQSGRLPRLVDLHPRRVHGIVVTSPLLTMNQKSPGITGLFLRACLAGASLIGLAASTPAAPSSWVFYDSSGNLQYQADANGNRIIDYSSAGYGG